MHMINEHVGLYWMQILILLIACKWLHDYAWLCVLVIQPTGKWDMW